MNTRIMVLFFLLFFWAGSGAHAQGTPHAYISHVADTIVADAGTATQIAVFLRNGGSATVTLGMQVLNDPHFSVDSLNSSATLQPNEDVILMVRFLSNAGGTYSALLTVTDGTVTDSVTITAVVTPRPFVLLPPSHSLYADLGIPINFSVTVQNLTSVELTVTITLSGDVGFTSSATSPVVIPANGSYTVPLHFVGNSEGKSQCELLVSNGSYSATTDIHVTTVNSPYKWITGTPASVVVIERRETSLFIPLRNTSGTPVTLYASLSGDPAFQSDSTSQNITVEYHAVLVVSFVSPDLGVHSTLLTVTDGVDIDTVTLTVNVIPGAGNFVITPFDASINVSALEPGTAGFYVRNTTNLPLSISASLTGDPRFSLGISLPLVIPAKTIAELPIHFPGAPVGIYRTQLIVADGSKTDTLPVVAIVRAPQGGNDLFVTNPLSGRALEFIAEPGGADAKAVSIRNLDSYPITVSVSILGDTCFHLSTQSVTIDSGASSAITITYLNPPNGWGNAQLVLESGAEQETIRLLGGTTAWTDHDGLRVMNYLDFGAVDTGTQYCRDVILVNTTPSSIGIFDIQLTGFAADFNIPSATAFNIPANDSAAIRICYTPTARVYEDNEILTFRSDNPAANPAVQSVAVNITGSSIVAPPSSYDSLTMIVNDVHTMIAPIGGFSEATFDLRNLAPRPIVLDALFPMQSAILLTPLPITLPAYDAAVAGSGTTPIRVRYAPTSASSTPNEDDFNFLLFGSSDTLIRVIYNVYILGKPVHPIPSSTVIAMYPENGLPPVITMGEPEVNSLQELRFRNNLTVPVTVTSCGLQSAAFSEISGMDALPAKVDPGNELRITLRITRSVTEVTPDAVVMHGSHEHLNSRYELYGGKLITGLEDIPVLADDIAVHAAPNPSSGVIRIQVDAALREGRVRIVDVLGRPVTEFEAGGGVITWDARAGQARIPAGSYFIHVSGIDENGRPVRAMRKLVMLP